MIHSAEALYAASIDTDIRMCIRIHVIDWIDQITSDHINRN